MEPVTAEGATSRVAGQGFPVQPPAGPGNTEHASPGQAVTGPEMLVIPPMIALLKALDGDGDGGWQDRAICAQTDPEAFYPEKGGSTREAKQVCRSCDVRAECLQYALDNDERFGVWGGMSERERRRLKRQSR